MFCSSSDRRKVLCSGTKNLISWQWRNSKSDDDDDNEDGTIEWQANACAHVRTLVHTHDFVWTTIIRQTDDKQTDSGYERCERAKHTVFNAMGVHNNDTIGWMRSRINRAPVRLLEETNQIISRIFFAHTFCRRRQCRHDVVEAWNTICLSFSLVRSVHAFHYFGGASEFTQFIADDVKKMWEKPSSSMRWTWAFVATPQNAN